MARSSLGLSLRTLSKTSPVTHKQLSDPPSPTPRPLITKIILHSEIT